MEGQGELTLRTSRRVHREVEGERRWVELAVSDTGPGIPQKVLANLFVPFVTTKNRGTGLGLAISQRIVAAAGGHIEVRSLKNVGTTFVVRLPAVEGPREPTAKIAFAEIAERNGATPGIAQSPSSPGTSKSESSEPEGAGELAPAGEVPTRLATSR